ncbi:MAG: helix-turn-helix transcriptional regulator [Firmicutes bacterium]|nr:helix-turn-helix transcriptional regulator [Bacillota bacterium]
MFSDIFSQLLQSNKTNPLRVARDLGIPKSIVYEWKQGLRDPSAENLKKLSDYFGVSPAYLLGSDDSGEQVDESERQLVLMLREAKRLSPKDHDELVENFKKNLDIYLRIKGAGKKND